VSALTINENKMFKLMQFFWRPPKTGLHWNFLITDSFRHIFLDSVSVSKAFIGPRQSTKEHKVNVFLALSMSQEILNGVLCV